MSNREKVPAAKRPASPGQLGNVLARIMPHLDFTFEEAESITKDAEVGKKFSSRIRRVIAEFKFSGTITQEVAAHLARWTGVYEKLFGEAPDLSQVRVPEMPEGFGPMRPIVVCKELIKWTEGQPVQGTKNALKKYFPGWQYVDHLDTDITENERDPKNGSYAVWVRDVREADEEFANKSANDLAAENHTGITVLERCLMEADYFWERGEHLDQGNVTLCAGSRGRGGDVPDAHWGGDKFNVRWSNPTCRSPYLRSRRVWV